MLDADRTIQLQSVARSMGYEFNAADDRGLVELIKDCSVPVSGNQLDKKCITNILTKRDLIGGRTIYIFDYLTDDDENPLKTMMLIRSTEFDFPFISVQPIVNIHPPKQRILKKRRMRTIIKIIPKKGKIKESHVVFTTNPLYWERIKGTIGFFGTAHRYMFLELHNFFFFFISKKNFLGPADIKQFEKTGLDLSSRLDRLELT